jgi:chromosome segregation ATPase
VLNTIPFRRNFSRAEIRRLNQRMAELKSEIGSLKEQMDVVVSYLRDHRSCLIAHERRLELAEGRIDLLDKVLGPIVKSIRSVRRRWRTLARR